MRGSTDILRASLLGMNPHQIPENNSSLVSLTDAQVQEKMAKNATKGHAEFGVVDEQRQKQRESHLNMTNDSQSPIRNFPEGVGE